MDKQRQETKMGHSPMAGKSSSTTNPDSYEAGFEIGENLSTIHPEVILLFTSVHYDLHDLVDGIYSGLETHDVLIFGGTGDGIYETENVADYGVAALGINSFGRIAWSISVRTETTGDSYAVARKCARDLLKQSGGPPNLALVLADLNCNGVRMVEGIRSVLDIPVIGGLAGDDWQFKTGYIVANGAVHRHAVGMLGMSGDFSFVINCASGWKPLGQTGLVEDVEDNVIRTIDDKTAFQFIEEQFGMPPADAALGMIPLAAYESPDSEHFFLRTPSNLDVETGEITYFGTIPKGTPVRVCNATVDDVVAGIDQALKGMGKLSFEPTCGLVISCGARKWLLGDRNAEEVSRVFDIMGKKIPLIGVPSYGEIGPFRNADGTYSKPFFHNVSYVIALFGPGTGTNQ